MSDETPSPASPSGWPGWIDEWILPYLHNRNLWPVWLALIGHVIVAVAGLGLLTWRTGLPEAGIALALLALGSGWLVAQEARITGPSGVTLTVALGWASSLGLAALAEATGLF